MIKMDDGNTFKVNRHCIKAYLEKSNHIKENKALNDLYFRKIEN